MTAIATFFETVVFFVFNETAKRYHARNRKTACLLHARRRPEGYDM